MKLSILIPARDDLRVIDRAEEIQNCIDISKAGNKFSCFEIYVIDDIYNHEVKNRLSEMNVNYISGLTSGKGSAVLFGLRHIESDHFLIIDSDNSISLESINALLCLLNCPKSIDLIYGIRVFRKISKIRRMIGICQLFLANLIVLPNFIQDTQCPLKYLSRSLRDKVIDAPSINGGMYDIILFYICDLGDFERVGLPVNWDDSPSMLKIHRILLNDLIDILLYRIRFILKNLF